jgi:DNA-binding response OmpR family regulator
MKQRALPPWPEGSHSAPIIVIEKRALIGESLALFLSKEFGCPVFSFPDIDSWRKASSGSGTQFVLASARGSDHEALHALGASEIGANVMVLPDATQLDDIVRGLERGAFAGPANKGLLL